ncbi:MAG: succinate dehydrogenase / fumarate reductase flavoprotein subunit [Chloroflexi bacterium]|nr:MAG: succinate dehydrogenase / fumarate reductase flavoprotein subunit [Chloroflexota bacterium]
MRYDVVVIGAGIAGLQAAVEARRQGASVAVITKVHPLRSYSITIQDGINAALAQGDSPQAHIADTLRSGDGLNDKSVVEAYCAEAPAAVRELYNLGVPFNLDPQGDVALVKLQGSEQARAAHVHDMTGHVLAQVLYEQALKYEVVFFEEWYVPSLAVEDGVCTGALAFQLSTGNLDLISGGAIVMAAGGVRRLYEPSTSSTHCNADGIGIAYRAGAQLVDMEMVQYHPSIIKAGRLAISELLLANGAQLEGKDGQAVTGSAQPFGHSLARAAAEAIASGAGEDGNLNLKTSITQEQADTTYYNTNARLQMFMKGNLAGDPIPVHPGMYRILGGIATDASGATSVSGLFAAGECAGTGFHGAGAMDGNGLLASVLSGHRAGSAAANAGKASTGEASPAILQEHQGKLKPLLERDAKEGDLAGVRSELTSLMHEKAGLSRDAAGLAEAAEKIASLKESYATMGIPTKALSFNYALQQHLETRTLLAAAEAIVGSAEARQESRGVHYRSDFPDKSDEAGSMRVVVEQGEGGPQVSSRPV